MQHDYKKQIRVGFYFYIEMSNRYKICYLSLRADYIYENDELKMMN